MKTLSTIAALVVLASLLVTATFLGNVSAYVTLISSLFCTPLLLGTTTRRAVMRDTGLRLFATSYLLIAVALVVSAQNMHDLAALGDFVALLLSAAIFALIYSSGRWMKPSTLALAALAGAATSVAVSVFEVFVLGKPRATGHFSSAIFMGDVSIWLGFLAFCGFWMTTRSPRWIFILGPILGVTAAILSGTRGALVAAIAISLSLIVAVAIKKPEHRRTTIFVVAGMFALVFVGMALFGTQFRLSSRFADMAELLTTGKTDDMSINFRLQYYEAGLKAFADAPVFGHGWWRRFTSAMPYMSERLIAEGSGVQYAHLHNELLNFGTAMGVLGGAAYLILATTPLVALRRDFSSPDTFGLAAMGLVLTVGMLSMGLVDAMLIFEMPKTVFCFTAAILFALASRERKRVAG